MKSMIPERTMVIIITRDKKCRHAAIDLDLDEDNFRLSIKWAYYCGYRTPEEVKEIFISYAREGKDILRHLKSKIEPKEVEQITNNNEQKYTLKQLRGAWAAGKYSNEP